MALPTLYCNWFHCGSTLLFLLSFPSKLPNSGEAGRKEEKATDTKHRSQMLLDWADSGIQEHGTTKQKLNSFQAGFFFSVNFSPVRHPALSISPNLVVWVSSVISGEGSAPLEGDSQANELPIRASPLSFSCWERRWRTPVRTSRMTGADEMRLGLRD